MNVPTRLPEQVEALVTTVIGCGLTVHRELGPGFLESIYHKALCLELDAHGLGFESEKAVAVRYRGWLIPGQRIDLVVGGQVIVEVKAVRRLRRIHEAQVLSYLKTTGLRVALLMNFRARMFREGLRRVVL